MVDWIPRIQRLGLFGKAAIVLAVFIVIALLLLGGVFALGTFFFYDSYSSTYEYEVSISVDGETENAVFLIPLPVHDGEPQLGELHFTESDRFEGIDHMIVDTEHGAMLRVEVDKVREGPHWHHLWFSAQSESNRTINTLDPRGTEPVLSPAEFVELDLDETIHDRWPDRRDFDASSTAYIEHAGEEDVEIGVSVWYRGGNDWWSFGWNGNYYETAVGGGWDAHDRNGAWIQLTGWHSEGAGNYPRFPPPPS